MVDSDCEPPLDITEFRCVAVESHGVVVVFEQTGRRYPFPWHDGELALSEPAIEGGCGPHPAEVIDCLARAVAYRASRVTPVVESEALSGGGKLDAVQPPFSRKLRAQLKGLLFNRT